jgi:hypothetical protein
MKFPSKFLNKYTATFLVAMILGSFLVLQFESVSKIEVAEAMYNDVLEEYEYVHSIYEEKQAEVDEYTTRLESLNNELEALGALLVELKGQVSIEYEKEIIADEKVPSVDATWLDVDDLQPVLDEYWKDTVLADKGDELILWCKRSSVPRVCVKVLAAQTLHETAFGTTGVGVSHKNLFGIRDQGVWRSYDQYYYSLEDGVNLFIDGNYQDYFTLYGWEEGLRRYTKRWGTNQLEGMKNTINTKLK